MKIRVYSGSGVSSLSLRESLRMLEEYLPTTTICADALINTPWEEDTALLVFPGGRDIPYDRDLRGLGTKKIRSYVENGGKFLGICAGAYFGCKEVIFEKHTPLEVHETRELGFFPGPAIGTVYPNFRYESENGAYDAPITIGDQTVPIYYNGGCYFDGAYDFPKTVKVLGTYENKEAAIISCKVGRGKAVLSGVHFEINFTSSPISFA